MQRRLVTIPLLALFALPAAQVALADREPDLARGSCDGLMDYVDELNPDQIQLVQEIALGNGLSRLEFTMQLANVDRGRFRSASAFPKIDPADNPLGVVLDPPPTEADFGAIDPYGSGLATTLLSLTLPSENAQAAIDQIEDGTIPLGVHADEETVYPDGTMVRNWNQNGTTGWDDSFRAWGPNLVIGSQPYEPGAFYEIRFPAPIVVPPVLDPDARPTYDGGAGDGAGVLALDEEVCAGALGGPGNGACYSAARGDAPLYITPGDDALYGLPASLHYVRVLVITGDQIFVNGSPVPATYMLVQSTDIEPVAERLVSGSFCTGPDQQLDPPVSETDFQRLDGFDVDFELGRGKNQQVRFNYLPWDHTELSLSGQIGCHSIKPKVNLRVREGRLMTEAGFETDCNLSAEARIASSAEVEEAREPFEMWKQCIPLPSLPVGNGGIPMVLSLRHLIDVGVSATAEAIVGFSQNWRIGFSVACEALGDGPAACTTDTVENPVTTDFTPPQLTDDTELAMHAETTLEAALRLGFAYETDLPIDTCDLGAGVTLDAHAGARFEVQPTFDPWWRATWGYGLDGGVDLGLIGLGLVNAEVTLLEREFPIADAGGPLLGGGLGAPQPRSAPRGAQARAFDPPLVSGTDQRWSVAVDDTAQPNGVNTTSIAALPDGSSIALAGEPVGGRGRIVKLDRFGAFQWAKQYALGKAPKKIRALSDGSVIVAGEPAWLARHDADGALLWSFDATVARSNALSAPCYLRDVVAIETAPGVYDYVAVGTIGAAPPTDHDGCALRVGADGDVAWSKVYEAPDLQYFAGATLLRDGAVAVVGEAHLFLAGNRRMAIVLELDAATGDVVWSRGLPTLRSARANAVVEGPDGTLFAVGAAGRTVTQNGAALLAAIEADGASARHGLLLQDFYWELELDFEERIPTSGGDTAYDELFDIAPQGDGFVVVGRSGLGTATDAWAAKINQKLGAEWFRTWDGASTDALTGVAVVDDGILVSGYSGSLPEPDGPNTGENQLWVMKLPFEGALALRENAAVQTHYIQPGVRWSSVDPAITLDDDGVSDLPLAPRDALVTNNAPNPNFATTSASQCGVLLTETGMPSLLDACAEDTDLDGVLDDTDVCVGVANADQTDSDADGFGNACDADLDQDGAIDDADRLLFAASFGLAEGAEGFDPAADFDGDGLVGLADFTVLRAMQGGAPGDAVAVPAPNALEMPLVELIFPATGTGAIEVESGALVTVQLRVTPGASGIAAYGFALDFGDGLDFDAATELLATGFDFALDPAWSVVESEAGLDGAVVACDAATLGAGAFGDPFVACEYSFVATQSAGLAARIRPGVDGVIAGTGADLSGQVALVPANVEVVPEAGGLAAALAACAALARLQTRAARRRQAGARARFVRSTSGGRGVA